MGPVSFDEVLRWATRHHVCLVHHDADAGSTLAATLGKNLQSGIIIALSYSGIGTAEYAVAQVCSAASAHEASAAAAGGHDIPPRLATMYSACDYDRVAQTVLLAHDSQSAPIHVFEDIMHRVDGRSRLALAAALQIVQGQVQDKLNMLEETTFPRLSAKMLATLSLTSSGTSLCVWPAPSSQMLVSRRLLLA